MKKFLLIVTLVAFGALTVVAVLNHGYAGIFAFQLESWAGVQVLVDLVIAVVLFLFWMFPDARAKGRNPWPYFVVSMLGGSFGPLLYLVLARDTAGDRRKPVSAEVGGASK